MKTARSNAISLKGLGRYSEAEQQYEEAIQILRGVGTGSDGELADLLLNYGDFLFFSKVDRPRGLQFKKEGLKICRAVHPRDHRRVARTLLGTGGLAHDMGDYLTAETYYSQGLEMQRRIDPESPHVPQHVFWLVCIRQTLPRRVVRAITTDSDVFTLQFVSPTAEAMGPRPTPVIAPPARWLRILC